MHRRGISKASSAIIVVIVITLIASATYFGVLNLTPSPNVNRPSCTKNDPSVADPSAPHGLFVNAANAPQSLNNDSKILHYILTDPTVCGANLIIPWSSVDQGPGANPRSIGPSSMNLRLRGFELERL
ncbi:MAG: hypothetical protein QW292_03855 [Candidatus Parvarchaeota archaeon]